ncbi:MAG: hypothetical protein CVU16_07440 [Betaproteobacteria bacterium HGW-Betaproteobacteria-10]|nr:MAG: hypothetical protein CVU16_07440 [Betaproteobacteria bacterium HGW-Betaproteobacteria-10]
MKAPTSSQLSPEQIAGALASCENEPIQRLGLIQPHGALLVLAADEAQSILQVSTNIGRFFPVTPEQIVTKSLSELIGTAAADEVRQLRSTIQTLGSKSLPLRSEINETALELQATLRFSGHLTLLEIELLPQPGLSYRTLDAFETVRHGMSAFQASTDVQTYCQIITGFVRSIIGFDRVMLYRFDADWEGEVIAESCSEKEVSYLGNRFPAGDIPPQARRLYTQNRLRLVADVNATPVALFPPLNAQTGEAPDMSFAVLRAFSPVHIEYLRNMAVGASLSISILLDDKLWGLIACHHREARLVPQSLREMLEFIGEMVSLKIAALDAKERVANGTRLGQAITRVISTIYDTDDIRHALNLSQGEIVNLLNATGAIIQVNGERYHLGKVPADDQITALLAWLATLPAAAQFSSNHLSDFFPPAAAYVDLGAGLLASPIEPGKQNFCLWFRPAKLQTVRWAGQPEKTIAATPDGKLRISPRHSFATWQEIWHARSQPWEPGLIDCAIIFARTLVDALIHHNLKQREAFFRLLGEPTAEMISRHSLTGVIRYVSPTSEYILGLMPAQLAGRQLAELAESLAPEDAAEVRKAFSEALGEATKVIFRYHHPDGQTHWLETTLKRVASSEGTDEIIAVSRDVSNQQQSSLALENFQQLNVSLLEPGGEAVIAIDRAGKVTYANPTACDTLGWPLDKLIGCHAHATVHHSKADGTPMSEAECPSSAVLNDGIPSLCRHDRYFRQDGSPIDIVTATTPIIKNNEITGAIVVFMPTGDSEYLSPLIAADQAGAIMTVDAKGLITSFSDGLGELTGYTPQEAVGQRTSLLKSEVHSRDFFRQIWHHLTTAGYWRGMIWNRCKNGTIRPLWVSMNTVPGRNGQVEQYVAIYGEAAVRSTPEARLRFLASHDSLTGLPNRTQLGRRLRQALSRATRQGTRLAVGFIDLDHFKEINDTYGHAIGDQFLIEIAHRLQETCRTEDTMARWGGDEFVFLMEDVNNPQTPAQLAERMLHDLAKPLSLAGQNFVPSASIGLALFPDEKQCAASLLELADSAMYQAKKAGGKQVVSGQGLKAAPASASGESH